MDGNQLLMQMKHLGEVESIKDVRPLTAAMFPGTHCPLMGAAMAVRGISDAMMLIIGTDECTYYTKHFSVHAENFGGLNGRCVSVALDGHDVTFGCVQKVTDAFAEMMEEHHPRAVFLVTTCVVEIIGDDIDALAGSLSERYGLPVMAVHTEHFKCENHLPGVERTMTACFDVMRPHECDGSVNLLGQRMGDFEETELCGVLREAGVRIGLRLPCGCSVEDIRNAPAARVNIVVDDTALPLARKMRQAFGTPYVLFDKYVSPARIAACYQALFDVLGLPLPARLENLRAGAEDACEQARRELRGVTYIYGNTPFRCYEFNRFMAEVGMVPQLIQTNAIKPEDEGDRAAILALCDPYVTKTANIAPLQYIYDVLHPMLYLGHEYAARLRAKGVALVRTDGAGNMLGYEVTAFVVRALCNAAKEARALREGGAA